MKKIKQEYNGKIECLGDTSLDRVIVEDYSGEVNLN